MSSKNLIINKNVSQQPYKGLFYAVLIILIGTVIGFLVGYTHCEVGYTGHGTRSGL